jgi:hypothetical protein
VKNAEKPYTCVLDRLFIIHIYIIRGGRDRMVVGFTATYAINEYHY